MVPTLFDSLQIALSISDFLELCEGGLDLFLALIPFSSNEMSDVQWFMTIKFSVFQFGEYPFWVR